MLATLAVALLGVSLLAVGPAADAQVAPPAPSLHLSKTVYEGHDDGAGCPGAELVQGVTGTKVTYCFVITNDGDTTLAPVTLTDADLAITDTDMTVLSGDLASLAPQDTATLYIESTIDGDLTNTATATGTPVDDAGAPVPGLADATGDDTAEVDEVVASLSLLTEVLDPFTNSYLDADQDAATAGTNDPTPAILGVGETATFRFTVANEGVVDITEVAVVAPGCDGSPTLDSGDDTDPDVLDADETWVFSCTVADVLEGLTMNAGVTGNVDGVAPDGTDQIETARLQVASISVDKTVKDPGSGDFVDSVIIDPGSDATFQIVVSNTGETPLAAVSVTDELAPECDHDFTDTVAPGETLTAYTCEVTDIADGFVNTATVAATPVDAGGAPAADAVVGESFAVVDVALGTGTTDLGISKDLVAADPVNDTATWQLTVANVGEITATEPIVVTDELPAALGFESAQGDGWSCEFDSPVVTCTTDVDLDPDTSTSFALDTSVHAQPNETVTNTAFVEGVDDTDVANNTDDAVLTVVDTYAQDYPLPQSGTELPRTGADIAGLLGAAGLLIVAGVGFRRAGRRSMG